MARRTLNHKALRADFDAAERRKTENTGEAGAEAEAAPTKKKAAASKTAKPKRTRTTGRQRVVWGVFNNSNARIETFPFAQKKEADEYAAKLKAEKGATFFVQPVKEPIEDMRE
jgi:hypothetical protein